jgi:haloacid dehalogenase superfamily, subfamily IA, variant 1 with third motif having Dx(3-4)D or Dx(3-4)E
VNKCIIFDFDGVIINSSEVQKKALIESYDRVADNKDYPSVEEFFIHSGEPLNQIFHSMGLPKEMVKEYQKISKENLNMIKVHKEVIEAMEYIKKMGFLCALCTGKDRERTMEILKKFNLYHFFNMVVCSDDVTKAKPHPFSVNLILETLNVKKENAVFIGDGINDVLCAKAAKIAQIAVTWGDVPAHRLEEYMPDYLVDTKTQLLDAISNVFKKKLLINDMVIREDLCNLKCKYCLTSISEFKKENSKNLENTYTKGSEMERTLDRICTSIHKNFDISILKLSGGEIFALKDILNFISKEARHYHAVQIITNGTLLNLDIIRSLKQIPNLSIQLSLDCHLMDGNSYRTKSEKIFKKVLDNLNLLIRCHIPVEINCVLTDQNTHFFKAFVEYVLDLHPEHVVILPFPVRGKERNLYFPRKDQLAEIEEIIQHYEQYEAVLPPKIYLKHMVDFIVHRKRAGSCYIPQIAIGCFDDGTITPCPNYWFESMGCLLNQEEFDTSDYYKKSKVYSILQREKVCLEGCRNCFTPWELLNYYMEGTITIEELCKLPLYRLPKVKKDLLKIKEKKGHKS